MVEATTLSVFAEDEMPERTKKLLASLQLPQLFAVISWGCAATTWTARALNSHPDVYCTHAGPFYHNEFGLGSPLNGRAFMRVIAGHGSLYTAAGDVHGIEGGDVPKLRALLGEHFEAAVLVRDPIPRLNSQAALFRNHNFRGWGSLEYIDELAKKAEIRVQEITLEQRHFLHGVNMLNSIKHEIHIGRIFRSEDITRDPASLVDLLNTVTRGQLDPSLAWAGRIIDLEPVNQHAHSSHGLGDWECDAIKKVVDPKAWDLYESLGYARPNFI